MTGHQLNRYLIQAKADINNKSIDTLVMGNEAADLDSMASALAYAYILSGCSSEKVIVPLMPIIREGFKLRTEAVYVFDQAGIDLNSLIFLDDINLGRLMEKVTSLALVDHNKLSALYEPYGKKVAIILDHHRDEGLYPQAFKKVIEPVGSCATLVGEELSRCCPELARDAHLATLLWGAILLDTVNLAPDAGRVTPKDEAVSETLTAICPLERNSYFAAIRKAKFNTNSLGTFDLLRKDYKEFKFSSICCGIASTLLPLALWGEKDPELCLSFETYVKQRSLDILISMNAYTDPEFNRDLAVYCADPDEHEKLIGFLAEKGLDLKTIEPGNQKPCLKGRISFHNQGNPDISRKKLSPMLDDYFSS
ncbi:MAG: DHH family phosphoesterase [Desulfobacterales bacterium]|nr:DHH family phosphoesterase [Desulfobacterales bacterium]